MPGFNYADVVDSVRTAVGAGGVAAYGFGGIPVASVVASVLRCPLYLVRRETDVVTARRTASRVVGPTRRDSPGPVVDSVVLIEDVVDSGRSVTYACTRLHTAGISVSAVYLTYKARFAWKDDLLLGGYDRLTGADLVPSRIERIVPEDDSEIPF